MAVLRPREGVCGGPKIFGFSLLQPARSVCVSPRAFFILLFVFSGPTQYNNTPLARCSLFVLKVPLNTTNQPTNQPTNQRPSSGHKMHQIRFRPGSAPDPGGGAHDAPPDPLVGWGGDTRSPFPSPRRLQRLDSHAFGVRLGAFGASLPAFRHFFFPSLGTGQLCTL